MPTEYWTSKDCAREWGVDIRWARRIMPRVPGYAKLVINETLTGVVPAGSPRPEKLKPGIKAKRER